MNRILVVDDTIFIREAIAAALRSAGYTAECVADGQGALAVVRARRPDLIVLDLSMPGLSGLDVLHALRADPATESIHVILLTATSEKARILEAARLGVRDYLLKSSFTTAELIARVGKYLNRAPAVDEAPAEVAPLSRTETVRQIRDAQVKALPTTVTNLILLAASPRASVMDVAHCLRSDPALSSQVIRVANSAAFASQRSRIDTIEEAVRHVGLSAVQNLAASVGVFEAVAGAQAGTSMLRLWQQSLAVAAIMERLASGQGQTSASLAYIVGLCSTLPEILFRQLFPQLQAETARRALQSRKKAYEFIPELFGMSASEFMHLLLDRLGLPATIAAPIRDVNDRAGTDRSTGLHQPLSQLLMTANLLAHGLLLGPNLDEPLRPLGDSQQEPVTASAAAALDLPTLRADAICTTGLLAGLAPSQMKELSTPLIPRRPLRLCYVRDEAGLNADPLLTMLSLIAAEVRTVESQDLPQVATGSDATIVAIDNRSAAGKLRLGSVVRAASIPISQEPGETPELLFLLTDPATHEVIPRHATIGPLPTTARAMDAYLAALRIPPALRAA